MGLGYVHADNFRFLTGRGRDCVDFLEDAIEKIIHNPHLVTDVEKGGYTHVIELDLTGPRKVVNVRRGAPLIEGDYVPHILEIIQKDPYGVVESIMFDEDFVINTTTAVKGKYLVYQHKYQELDDTDRFSYIGITKRGWQTRWSEHLRSAQKGSQYRFHAAIRKLHKIAPRRLHWIMSAGLTEDQAYEYEESYVENMTLYPLGLNMIPGGKSGLDYLRRIGALGKGERINPEDRCVIIENSMRSSTLLGRPNPLLASMWTDDEFAVKVICGPEGRLKPEQIKTARFMYSLGKSVDDIAREVSAKNVAQVARMLRGSTYSRIA